MNNNFECVSIPNFTQPLIRLYQESIVSSFDFVFQHILVFVSIILYFK
jgi:hypothetical protein